MDRLQDGLGQLNKRAPECAFCLLVVLSKKSYLQGLQALLNQVIRTTCPFQLSETSEKILFACACQNRGLVSAHRCPSAVGFSSPVLYTA